MQVDPRTIVVLSEPEPGSWTPKKAYTNPKEYNYYTFKLIKSRTVQLAQERCMSKFILIEKDP